MKFDSNLAWKQASEAVTANREVLLAIAGVFVLLPNLAFALLFPQPELPPGVDGTKALEIMQAYYGPAMPWLLLVAGIQAVGTLAMLTLFTDRSRPTVGIAIRQGAASLLPYIIAHLMIGMGMALAGGVMLGIAAATGVAALVAVAIIAAIIGAITIVVRTSLTSPVIAVDGERNPVAAVRRSWQLTKGNAMRIFSFYLLVAVAFMVAMMVVMLLIGALLAVVLGTGETARMIATLVSSSISAVMTIYFVGMIAAVHRQMTGPSAQSVSTLFE